MMNKKQLIKTLLDLKEQGLDFSMCVRAFGVEKDKNFIASQADEQHGREGECEIDDYTVVSEGEDPGAYVMAWVWVELEKCSQCGCIEGTPEWGTVGDGYDGMCPSCADAEDDNENDGSAPTDVDKGQSGVTK